MRRLVAALVALGIGLSAATAAAQPPDEIGPRGLEQLAWCESRLDYTAVDPSGTYHGRYQFVQSTWDYVMGELGEPAWVGVLPSTAPQWIQDRAAQWLWNNDSSGHWPICQHDVTIPRGGPLPPVLPPEQAIETNPPVPTHITTEAPIPTFTG